MVQYIKKIMHRHIILGNILINYEDENDKENNNITKGEIKIIDFGFSRYIKKGELTNIILWSPNYMSPIILNRYNEVKGYENAEYDEKDLVKKVNTGDYYLPTTLSKEAMSFLNCMIQFNPQKRLDIEKLCKHEF